MSGEYYKTKESVEEYIKLAEGISGKQLIDNLKKVLQENSDLLEIGSGPGTDWNILDKTYNITGSDNSTEFIEHLVTENPMGIFLELDAVTLKTDQIFDGIYSNKVLHHLKDDELEKSIHRQYEILNSNGVVCHSFWKGTRSEIFKGLFVNYQDETSLEGFFGKLFNIISINSYKEFEEGDSLLLIARK